MPNTPFILTQRNFSTYQTQADADAALLFKQPGQIIYEISTDSFFYWDGVLWIPFGTGGGGSPALFYTYKALLTQTGTNPPVATVLEDTIVPVLTWTRVAPGEYHLTAPAGTFPQAKTFFYQTSTFFAITWVSDSDIKIMDFFAADNDLVYTPFEIQVYI